MKILVAALAVSLGSAAAPTASSAQSEEALEVVASIAHQAELMKMAYDAARLANAIAAATLTNAASGQHWRWCAA